MPPTSRVAFCITTHAFQCHSDLPLSADEAEEGSLSGPKNELDCVSHVYITIW